MQIKQLLQSTLICCIISMLAAGCGAKSTANNPDEEAAKKSYVEKQVVTVTTTPVRKGSFAMELLSNGKLAAVSKAMVPFVINEQVAEVMVKNGDRVNAGDVLAQLDAYVYRKRVDDARLLFEKTSIDLEDQLLGYGFALKDTAKVPAHLLKVGFIRSGYSQAKANLAEAQRNLSHTRVVAPISGVVANLEARANNPSSAFNKCCEVLNDRLMKVDFMVLEGEMGMIAAGQKVEVIPFANTVERAFGAITAINPSVDANGMIQVTAQVDNPTGKLMDGMNVKVLVKREVPNCIVIPKSAVLYRQNRKVVFVSENNKAIWVYVEVGLENSTEVTITDNSLTEGQQVIVTNNLNLAHETPIAVNSKQ